MATSRGISSRQDLEITECSICGESFKEPKVLPCIHTFCLDCLEKYGEEKEKNPGDKLDCPLCRNIFTIPLGGFKDLRNNYFIIQMMQLSQLSDRESKDEDAICELCSELGETPPAVVFCVKCSQHLCQPCCTRHAKQRSSMRHEVVSLKDKPNSKELIKMILTYCEQHPTDEIKFYCYDCNMIACVVCYVDKHGQHKCSDVKKSGDEFRIKMKGDTDLVEPYIVKCLLEIRQLKESMIDLKNNATSIKIKISNKYNELRAILDSQQNELHAELDSFQEKRLKEMETRIDELERQAVILENYKRYCEKMMEKGTSCDVSLAANDLHVRAKELLEIQTDLMNLQLFPVNITFTPSTSHIYNNWIGQFETEAIDTSLIVIGLDDGPTISSDVYRISLRQPNGLSTMSAIPTKISEELPACSVGYNVYVTGTGGKHPNKNDGTWRLDLLSGNWFRCADMITGRRRHCACIIHSQLYVLGGWNEKNVLGSVECYNTMTDAWSPAGNLVHAVESAVSVTYNNFIYVFGGDNAANRAVAHVQVYNLAAAVQMRCTLMDSEMPCPVLGGLRAVLWGTSVILMDDDTCLVYNFETQTWQEKKQARIGVFNFGVILDNQTIYIAGGGIQLDNKGMKLISNCTDEIKSASVLDIIRDRSAIVWKHHAKLPKPAMIHSCCLVLQSSKKRLTIST